MVLIIIWLEIYKTVDRKLYVGTGLFVEFESGWKAFWDAKSNAEATRENYTASEMKANWGTKLVTKGSGDVMDQERYIFEIQSHNDDYWRTKNNRNDEGHCYLPKTSASEIKSTELVAGGSEGYGDEVTPQNSIFSFVRGST